MYEHHFRINSYIVSNRVIILLLAEDDTKLGVVVVGFFELRAEDDQDPVLQKIIELNWI
jgi:hypothetical protein